LHTARCVTKQFTSYHVRKIALDSHIHIQIYLKLIEISNRSLETLSNLS